MIPEKSDISEAIGLLQQCTKVQVHSLGCYASVLYDTVTAYVSFTPNNSTAFVY